VVGNWESDVAPAWWQDAGYQTSAYFLRFGHSLVSPLFAGLSSFWDGL
jgi:hypothetical protein